MVARLAIKNAHRWCWPRCCAVNRGWGWGDSPSLDSRNIVGVPHDHYTSLCNDQQHSLAPTRSLESSKKCCHSESKSLFTASLQPLAQKLQRWVQTGFIRVTESSREICRNIISTFDDDCSGKGRMQHLVEGDWARENGGYSRIFFFCLLLEAGEGESKRGWEEERERS